jgi:Family of unknown function (DUF6582)
MSASALDKVLRLSNTSTTAGAAVVTPGGQPAPVSAPHADLVLAAVEDLRELATMLFLAASDDDEDDEPENTDSEQASKGSKNRGSSNGKSTAKRGTGNSEGSGGDEDDDVTSDPLYKKLTSRGMNSKAAAAMVRRKQNMAACHMLAEGALVALAGIPLPTDDGYDWVEATAAPLDDFIGLASDGDGKTPAKPYGDVPYADPGYRGKKRYPIDKEHIRAALSYFSKPKNRKPYTPEQVKAIWGRIKSAARKFGINLSDDTGKVAATAAFAAGPAAMISQHHEPMTGTHTHPHTHVHDNSHGGRPAY